MKVFRKKTESDKANGSKSFSISRFTGRSTTLHSLSKDARDILFSELGGDSTKRQTQWLRLFESNESPTDDERRKLISAQTSLRSRIQILSSSPANQHELQTVKQLFRNCESVMSPVRSLPFEILQEVMQYCLPYEHGQGMCTLPWNVSQVCTSWRGVAFASPKLWTKIATIHLHKPHTSHSSFAKQLQLIIERSQSFPIDIAITAEHFKGTSHPLLKVLVDSCAKWRSLDLTDFTVPLLYTLKNVKGKLSALEELTVDIRNRESLETPVDIFSIAPRLQKFANRSGETTVDVPFSNITSYCSTTWPEDLLQGTSPFASHLDTLILRSFTASASNIQVTFPVLKCLEIAFQSADPQNVLFNNITCPQIEFIKLEDASRSVLPHLATMLLRSGSPASLKTFILISKQARPGELTSVLRNAPALTNMRVSFPSKLDLQNLTVRNGQIPLVPNLSSLDILCHNLVQDPAVIHELNEMARSRCEDGARVDGAASKLTHLQVHFSSYGTIHTQRARFERGCAGPNTSVAVLKTLDDLGEDLQNMIPEIKEYYLDEVVWVQGATKAYASKVFAILQTLQQIPLDHIKEIWCSTMPHILKRLQRLSALQKKDYAKHPDVLQFFNHTNKILDSWTPLLLDMTSSYRWFVQGHCSTLYICETDDRRKSVSREELVFGMKMKDASLWSPYHVEFST